MIKILKMDSFRREDILPEPPEQAEISNSVKEVLATVEPLLDKHSEYEKLAILERITEPERIIPI